MLGMNYGPDGDPLATLADRAGRDDLRLCAQPRLSRPHQGRAEADRDAVRGARRRGREGLRRHRAGDGEAARRSGRARLAGQAHQSRQPRVRLVAVPRRDLHDGRARARRAPRRIIAARAGPASTSARPNAFPAPYRLDARRCISYLTIEHRRADPARAAAADRQPHLRLRRLPGGLPVEQVRRRRAGRRSSRRATISTRRALEELARLDDAAFRKLFSGSPIKRIGRGRFVRNVLIAIGNSGDAGTRGGGRAAARRRRRRRCAARRSGRCNGLRRTAFRALAARRARGAAIPTCATSGPPQPARQRHDQAFRFPPSASSTFRRSASRPHEVGRSSAARWSSARRARSRFGALAIGALAIGALAINRARGEAGAHRAPLGRHARGRPARHPRRDEPDEVCDEPEARGSGLSADDASRPSSRPPPSGGNGWRRTTTRRREARRLPQGRLGQRRHHLQGGARRGALLRLDRRRRARRRRDMARSASRRAGKKSIWSQINIKRVGELKAEGRMHPAGIAAFEARDPGDGRTAIRREPRRRLRRRTRSGVPRQQEGLGEFFSAMPPVLSPAGDLVGGERQAGGDARAAARDADRGFRGRAADQADDLPPKERRERGLFVFGLRLFGAGRGGADAAEAGARVGDDARSGEARARSKRWG